MSGRAASIRLLPTLNQRLTTIFEGIVDAYDAQSIPQRLMHIKTLGGGGFINVNWGDRPEVSRDDLDDFEAYGLLDVEYVGKHGNYSIKPTPEGRRAVAQLQRERDLGTRKESVDLSWAAVRPVLRAVLDEWERSGAAGSGVSAHEIANALGRLVDLQLIRALEALEEDGFVAVEWEMGNEAPVAVRPRSKAFAGTRGWPGGDNGAIAERLVTALDEMAQSESTKSGWAVRARDVFSEVSSKTLAEVIYRAGGGT